MLSERAVQATAANGSFVVTEHAIESFRIRLANLPKSRAEQIIRRQVMETVRTNRSASLEPTREGDGYLVKVTLPKFKHKFWAVLSEAWEEPGLMIIPTVYQPRRLSGNISLVEHNSILDDLRRQLLRAEDRYHETFERILRKESERHGTGSTGTVHCECCIHRLLTDEEDDQPDVSNQAHSEPGSGADSEREV